MVFTAAGVTALAFPLSVLVPLLNLLMVFGIAAVYYLWFARSWSWLIQGVAAALALTWALGGAARAVILMIIVMIPGLLMTTLRHKRRGLSTALLAAGAIPVLLAVAFSGVTGELVATFGDQLRAIVQSPQMAQLYSPADYQRAAAYVEVMASNARYYLPATLIAMLVFVNAAGALLGEFMAVRSGYNAFRIPSFAQWKLDEWMVIPVGLAIIAVLSSQEAMVIIGWNALLLLFLIYSVFGLSFLEYQMRTRGFPTPIKVVTYVFLFLTQLVAAVILPLIALFDAKFDFRKIRAKQLG